MSRTVVGRKSGHRRLFGSRYCHIDIVLAAADFRQRVAQLRQSRFEQIARCTGFSHKLHTQAVTLVDESHVQLAQVRRPHADSHLGPLFVRQHADHFHYLVDQRRRRFDRSADKSRPAKRSQRAATCVPPGQTYLTCHRPLDGRELVPHQPVDFGLCRADILRQRCRLRLDAAAGIPAGAPRARALTAEVGAPDVRRTVRTVSDIPRSRHRCGPEVRWRSPRLAGYRRDKMHTGRIRRRLLTLVDGVHP